MAYTVGLVAYDDATGGGFTAQQGVQQTYGTIVTASFSIPASVHISVYPNPTEADLHVVIDPSLEGTMLTLSDMTGRMVSTRTLHEGDNLLDMRPLAAGTYMVAVHGAAHLQQSAYRIIKR